MHKSPSPTLSWGLPLHIHGPPTFLAVSSSVAPRISCITDPDSVGISSRLKSEGEKKCGHILALHNLQEIVCCPRPYTLKKKTTKTTIGKESQTWKSPPVRFYSWQDKSMISVVCLKVEFSCTCASSKTPPNINNLDFTLLVLLCSSSCEFTLFYLYRRLICPSFPQLLQGLDMAVCSEM